jgi:predicted phosphodiesterase
MTLDATLVKGLRRSIFLATFKSLDIIIMQDYHRVDINSYVRSIKIPKGTAVFVIGDIHEQQAQFDKLLDLIQPSPERIIVSIGDVYDRGDGPHVAEAIILRLRELQQQGLAYFVRGNHEARRLLWWDRKKFATDPAVTEWISQQPLALSFSFVDPLRLKLVVLHGGVTPRHTWQDLNTNTEVMYVRQVDQNGEIFAPKWDRDHNLTSPKGTRIWHEAYDGRFGYIISGHDRQQDGNPKFYQHSCNVDTGCYRTGILTAQEYHEKGLGRTIQTSR